MKQKFGLHKLHLSQMKWDEKESSCAFGQLTFDLLTERFLDDLHSTVMRRSTLKVATNHNVMFGLSRKWKLTSSSQLRTTFDLLTERFLDDLHSTVMRRSTLKVATNHNVMFGLSRKWKLISSSQLRTTPHICHNHHNRWLCKSFESSVKLSAGYSKESGLSVITHRVYNLTQGVVFHSPCNFTQCVIWLAIQHTYHNFHTIHDLSSRMVV